MEVQDLCDCGDPVNKKKSRDGYEYVACPNTYKNKEGEYVDGCNYWARIPIPKGKGFTFGVNKGKSFDEVYKNNRNYFIWCKNNVKPNKYNEDLFKFIKDKGI
jgi:hypothetical protein